MIASLDDAMGMLSKWSSESTPLSLLFVADSFTFSLEGFVIRLNSDAVVIAHKQPGTADITIGLHKVASVHYKETRTAPDALMGDLSREFTSCLTLKMVGGGEFLIYELST